MGESSHKLHVTIGNIVENSLNSDCRLVKDMACGGNQQIPLFIAHRARKTEYCNVDLLVLCNDKIRVIIEIEESNVIPTQICGKFLTSALCQYYIHSSENDVPREMAESVTFIQIVDTKGLKLTSSKPEQWKNIENSIRKIIPVRESVINKYWLFLGSNQDFIKGSKREKLIDVLKGDY